MSRVTLAPMSTTAIRAHEPITERSAVDLAAAIRRGELRSREVVDAHIELIERRNPRDQRDRRDPLRRRRARRPTRPTRASPRRSRRGPRRRSSACRARSRSRSPSPACRTPSGSLARKDVIAEETATAVARLRAAGAIPLGVTNTSELTLWIESDNRV